jgi:hypothetical protein
MNGKTNFQGDHQAHESNVGVVVPSVALLPRAKFAAELLREIRSGLPATVRRETRN